MKKTLLTISVLMITALKSWAALPPADSTQYRKKLSLTPFPALFSSPETGIGYGALVVPVYNFGQDSLTRNSNGQVLGYLTQKDQSSLQISYNIYTNNERYIINGNANYYDFPIQYYGTGNSNEDIKNYTIIDYKLLFFQNRLLKKVKQYVFAGGQYHINKIYDIGSEDINSKLYERPAKELDGTVTSGLGPVLLLDSRDNPLNSTAGFYADFSSLITRKGMGSEFNFTRYVFDVRRFISLGTKQVIAFQGLGRFHSGQVPFRELSLLGGGRTMRGFYEGRFRDRQLIALQSEYRQQVFSRVGFVAFAGAGEVENKLTNMNKANMRFAAGGGIRLMLNRKQRLNIRIDYAIGNSGTKGLYFDIGEAF